MHLSKGLNFVRWDAEDTEADYQPLLGRAQADDNAFRNTDTLAEVGHPRDFLWGFIMGLSFGFIVLIWILYNWEHGPYQLKMGILTGVSCQLAFRLLLQERAQNELDDASKQPHNATMNVGASESD